MVALRCPPLQIGSCPELRGIRSEPSSTGPTEDRLGKSGHGAAMPGQDGVMLIVHVFVHVLPEAVDAFIDATRANAAASLREPGIARFDVVQSLEDPTRFVLVEAYRTEDAPGAHKETAHYATWRDTVADLMAEPRSSMRYRDIAFPD
jgi:quinol monooxygenase YgiN